MTRQLEDGGDFLGLLNYAKHPPLLYDEHKERTPIGPNLFGYDFRKLRGDFSISIWFN